MGKKIRFIKSFFDRMGTSISPFAILHNVEYDDTTAIRPLVKMERAVIGKCSSIGTLSAAYDCEIGKFCSIARECYIGGAQHPLDRVSTSGCFYLRSNYTKKCFFEDNYEWHTFTKIGSDVWIGIRSIVLGGITIGDGAVIGAGSVVTKDIGPYEIWAGNPARFIRKRFEPDIIEMLLAAKWWDWDEKVLSEMGSKFKDVNQFIGLLRNKK